MNKYSELYKLFCISEGIETDSRKLTKGKIFWALKGENYDGNSFAEAAIDSGALVVVVSEKTFKGRKNFFYFENTLLALQEVAKLHRNNLTIPIIGITGTNGKTTTKELITSVLSKKYKTLSTAGNFNNHLGVPLTILNIKKEHQIAVIEMGANHPGEIDFLCNIARPNFGLITNIGKGHLEGFGNFETIIKTKQELYNYINLNSGFIFYNSDNKILKRLKKTKKRKSYGTKKADLKGRLLSCTPYVKFEIENSKSQEKTIYNTQLYGNYNFENALAAYCVGDFFSVKKALIKEALSNYIPSNNRSQIIEKEQYTITLDAYNANPSSMKAALDSFFEINENKHKLFILGDMFELGKYAISEHKKTIKLCLNFIEKEKNTVSIIFVGENFLQAGTELEFSNNNKIIFYQNTNELQSFLQTTKLKTEQILIKGSRGMKLEKILNML